MDKEQRTEAKRQRRRVVKKAMSASDLGERAERIDEAVDLSSAIADHR